MNSDNSFAIARKRMMSEQIVARGISDPNVLEVMSLVPRHVFVDEALKSQSYTDAPLNIGEGQTISQPYIVALMTQTLRLTGHEKVLEIGTGCGYQAVILARLAKQLYTIERIQSLAMQARQRFKSFGCRNIVLRIGDGSLGWPQAAPFDRILATCVAPSVPDVLLNQLAMGGVLVIPVEAGGDNQDLWRIVKTESGFTKENLGPCRFVKLIGEKGYS